MNNNNNNNNNNNLNSNLNSNKYSPSTKGDRLISPVKSYGNAELFREAVLKDNRGRIRYLPLGKQSE
jgi:hypothetical protein